MTSFTIHHSPLTLHDFSPGGMESAGRHLLNGERERFQRERYRRARSSRTERHARLSPKPADRYTVRWDTMILSTEQLVQEIHDSPTRIVLAAAGGGSRAIADLLEVPGGSRTLLEAVVPYSAAAMTAWLGGPTDEACSAATARAMAMVAFLRAGSTTTPERQ